MTNETNHANQNLPPDQVEIEFDIVLAEFTGRVRDGVSVDISAYATRYPDMADQINELFPLVLQLEGSKNEKATVAKPLRWKTGEYEKIGDYSLIREIGRGGMGVVYEARQESLDRRVALKVLRQNMASDPKDLARFQREARLAALLHHSNIVSILGTGTENGSSFIVMPIIDGVGLDQSIDHLIGERHEPDSETVSDQSSESFSRDIVGQVTQAAILRSGSNAIDWNKFARLALQIANALAHAHEREVIHRDIKPSNLLLDRNGKPWIVDFGLARTSTIGDDATRVAGTPRYMAPEQALGNATASSDIFSLGLTLYELAGRVRVFQNPGHPDEPHDFDNKKIKELKRKPLQRLRKFSPDVPGDIERIVMRCVSFSSQDRYRSAAELVEDLERFTENRPLATARFAPVDQVKRWAQRNPQTAIAAAIAGLLLAGLASMFTMNYWRERALRTTTQESLSVSISTLDKVYDRLAPDNETQQPLSEANAQLLNDLLVSYDQLARLDSGNVALKITAANANFRVGDIHRRLGNPDEANLAFDQAIASYQSLATSQPEYREVASLQQARAMVLQGSIRLGGGNLREGRLFDALKFIESVEENLTAGGRSAIRLEKARALYFMGQAPKRQPADFGAGQPKDNEVHKSKVEFLDRSIGILEQWSKPRPDEVTSLLARCYMERSKDFGDEDTQRSIALQNSLVEKNPTSLGFRLTCAEANAEFDPLQTPRDQYPMAMSRLKTALRVSNGLDLNDERVERLVMHSHHKAAMIFERVAEEPGVYSDSELQQMMGNAVRNPQDEAIKHARKALEFQEREFSPDIRGPGRSRGLAWLLRFRITLCRLLWNRNKGVDREEVTAMIERSRTEVGPINLTERGGKSIVDLLNQLTSIGE